MEAVGNLVGAIQSGKSREQPELSPVGSLQSARHRHLSHFRCGILQIISETMCDLRARPRNRNRMRETHENHNAPPFWLSLPQIDVQPRPVRHLTLVQFGSSVTGRERNWALGKDVQGGGWTSRTATGGLQNAI